MRNSEQMVFSVHLIELTYCITPSDRALVPNSCYRSLWLGVIHLALEAPPSRRA